MKNVRILTNLVLALFVFALFGQFVLVCNAQNVNVTPWGDPNITQFPAASPPNDLGDDGDADATPWVGYSHNGLSGTWDSNTNTLTVTGVNDVNIYGRTDIRESNEVDPNLHEHELGHDRLNRYEYERRARTKIEQAL